MNYLSRTEIKKLAEKLKAKHAAANPGASLSVSSKGGGVNLGKLTTTLSPVQGTPGGAKKEEGSSVPYPNKR